MIKKKPQEKTFGSKHRDNLILLASDSEFLKRTTKIRKRLEIPVEMYTTKNMSDKAKIIQSWNEKIDKKTEEINNDKNHSETLRELECDFTVGKIKPKEYDKIVDNLNQKYPFNYLKTEVHKIIGDFILPTNYESCLIEYILYGDFGAVPHLPFNFKLEKNRWGGKHVSLFIYEKLKEEDWRKIKNFTNKIVGNGLPDIRHVSNMKEKILANNYLPKKIQYDSVTGKKSKVLLKEITQMIKEDTGVVIPESKLYDYAREAEKMRNKRFHGQGKK